MNAREYVRKQMRATGHQPTPLVKQSTGVILGGCRRKECEVTVEVNHEYDYVHENNTHAVPRYGITGTATCVTVPPQCRK